VVVSSNLSVTGPFACFSVRLDQRFRSSMLDEGRHYCHTSSVGTLARWEGVNCIASVPPLEEALKTSKIIIGKGEAKNIFSDF
jgi:hypothetical protein